ncbi:prolyl oligopeptidase family serine peptidase [Massilia sp. H-1]|nr:prolyl oligopeptidase family serine peptidase [Massilia sp. H-1]
MPTNNYAFTYERYRKDGKEQDLGPDGELVDADAAANHLPGYLATNKRYFRMVPGREWIFSAKRRRGQARHAEDRAAGPAPRRWPGVDLGRRPRMDPVFLRPGHAGPVLARHGHRRTQIGAAGTGRHSKADSRSAHHGARLCRHRNDRAAAPDPQPESRARSRAAGRERQRFPDHSRPLPERPLLGGRLQAPRGHAAHGQLRPQDQKIAPLPPAVFTYVDSPDLRVRSFEFKGADGLALSGHVALLRAGVCEKTRCPSVLLVHGGPSKRDFAAFDAQRFWLTSRGIAVITINYRGSSGFGERFLQMDARQWGLATFPGTSTSAWPTRWPTSRLDPDRVAGMGTSFGGYLTMHLAAA